MSDETAESYKWILEYTIKITIIKLLVFIIDANLTTDVAIKQIYLTTYPIYCIFYISENLSKNLKFKLYNQYDKFIYDFFIYHNSMSEELFYKK